MDANQAFGPEFASPEAASVARPRTLRILPCPLGVTVSTQAPDHEVVNTAGRVNESDDDDDDPNDTQTAYQVVISEEGGRKRRKTGGKLSRCRMCGHECPSKK